MKHLVEFPSESGEPIIVEVEDLELAGGGGNVLRGMSQSAVASPRGIFGLAITAAGGAGERASAVLSRRIRPRPADGSPKTTRATDHSQLLGFLVRTLHGSSRAAVGIEQSRTE